MAKSMTGDDELIDLMVAEVWPRLRKFAENFYLDSIKQDAAADEVSFDADLLLDAVALLELPPIAVLEAIWRAPLTDVGVDLLWAVAAKATKGTFIASDSNVAAAVSAIDLEDLARETGLEQKDLPFLLAQMSESLVAIIRKHGILDVQIDRRPFRLRATKKPSVFSRIFKFIF